MSLQEFIEGLSPIFQFISQSTDTIAFVSQQMLDVLKKAGFLFSGDYFPAFLQLAATIFISIFLARFLLLK